MAGPIVKGDLDVSEGIIEAIRVNQDLDAVTASGTETSKTGGIVNITGTANITRTLPAANGTLIGAGWSIRYVNSSTGTVTINNNGGVSQGTIAAGRSADVVCLVGTSANGTWDLIQLDQDNTGVTKDTTTFNATTNWGTAAGGVYTQTITAANHGAGTTPTVQVQDGTTTFEDVVIEVNVNATGDVSLLVNETPDGRFAGRAIIF